MLNLENYLSAGQTVISNLLLKIIIGSVYNLKNFICSTVAYGTA